MKNIFRLVVVCLLFLPLVHAQQVTGDWLGTLDAGMKLRVVFHFSATNDGLKATMDSPDQGVRGISVKSVALSVDDVVIDVPAVGGEFKGKINAARDTIEGKWKQGPGAYPLTLTKITTAAVVKPSRPQTPVKPYPYRDEEVAYENKVAGIRLAATLTLPSGKGPFPAVVLLTGSGAQDRDETLLEHRPFLVLADYLTRRGFAVLRADDRGVAKSGGNFSTATSADFATDAEAGVAYLKTRPEIDARKIGLIGHSEGGAIAPMIAARNSDVAFIVMMAGSGVSGEDIVVEQAKSGLITQGADEEIANKAATQQREILEMLKRDKSEADFEKDFRAVVGAGAPEALIRSQVKALTSPWYRYFIEYDPATALRKVKCPVLALIGEKDIQVPPKQNLPAIRKALEDAGNTNFETAELPGLNHLFQPAKTGLPSEYGEIEQTISPAALEKIGNWVAKQTK